MEHLPKVRGEYQQVWEDVSEIIVGVEGPGKEKWRQPVLPAHDLIEQELPQAILTHQSGWYFVRIYDAMGDLMESFEFKFVRGLKNVKVPSECLCPGSVGHQPVVVELNHEPCVSIQPADENSSNALVQHTGNETVLSIPPDPLYDETKWTIVSSGAPAVDVSILVERLWWAISDRENEPTEWVDKTVVMGVENFLPTSSKALWIRFPMTSWCEGVHVGFSHEKTKNYPVRNRSLSVPLSEFCDCEPLYNSPGLKSFHIWIDQGRRVLELIPCSVLVRTYCRFDGCNFVANEESEMVQHIVVHHAEKFFCKLDYDELRRVKRDLPQAIYKCPYCNDPPFYVESGDLRNPTSTILSHIDSVHIRPVGSGSRLPKVEFMIVTDVEEIRGNIIASLPRYFKCGSCHRRFEKEPSRGEMIEHLAMYHRNEIYHLR